MAGMSAEGLGNVVAFIRRCSFSLSLSSSFPPNQAST